MTNLQLRLVTLWETTNGFGNAPIYWKSDLKSRTLKSDFHELATFSQFKRNYINHKPVEIEGVPVEFYLEFKKSGLDVQTFMHSKRGKIKSRVYGF